MDQNKIDRSCQLTVAEVIELDLAEEDTNDND